MTFIGQEHIIRELGILLPEMQKGKKTTIMLKASSGYGKTVLACKIMNFLLKDTGE